MAQHNLDTTALDPDLLSTPFEVQTNWHVLTGAACSGKTTLIDMLAENGYQTGREIARVFIDNELAAGRTLDEIFHDVTTEPRIEQMQLELERGFRATNTVFLDRAQPDCIPFFRFVGLDPNECLKNSFHFCYASVFILDLLPLQLDGARVEDDTYTTVLDEWLVRDYSALGYEVIRVPVLPLEERLAFILDNLAERGLID